MPNVNDMGLLETLQDSARREQQAEDTAEHWITGLRHEYARLMMFQQDLLAGTQDWPMSQHTRQKIRRMQRHMRDLKRTIDLY